MPYFGRPVDECLKALELYDFVESNPSLKRTIEIERLCLRKFELQDRLKEVNETLEALT